VLKNNYRQLILSEVTTLKVKIRTRLYTAVRLGDWKYIPAPGSGGWGKGGDQSQPVQLYNLADDLGETKNLAAAMPEKVAEIRALLEKTIADGRSTPGEAQRNDVEVKRYPSETTETPRNKKEKAVKY